MKINRIKNKNILFIINENNTSEQPHNGKVVIPWSSDRRYVTLRLHRYPLRKYEKRR